MALFKAITASLIGTRPSRWIGVLIAGCGIIAVTYYAADYALNPWAYAWSRPALVGYWQGEIVVEPGDRRSVVLRLVRPPLTRGESRHSNIAGAARVCDSGSRVDYTISGGTHDWQGTRFRIGFGGDGLPPGKHPDGSEVTWDGRDRLEVSTTVNSVDAAGARHGTASIDASTNRRHVETVMFELRRTTREAFERPC